jgi:hypothetical protein
LSGRPHVGGVGVVGAAGGAGCAQRVECGPDGGGAFLVEPAGDPDLAGAGDVGQPQAAVLPGALLGAFQLGERPLLGFLGCDDFEDPLPEPAQLAWPEGSGLADEVFLPGGAVLDREFGDRVGDDLNLVDVHLPGGERLGRG